MSFASAAPATLEQSLQQRLLDAIDEHDLDGFRLLIQIAAAQLGAERTTVLIAQLPCLTSPDLVPLTLQFIHGPDWLAIARNTVIAAGHELAAAGAVPGRDYSYAPQNGHPVLLMTKELYSTINELNPGSLHLIRAFIALEAP